MLVGGAAETEAAYREAIAAGHSEGWLGVGNVLSKQPGREREAETALRGAIDSGATGQDLEAAAGQLGELLARPG